MSSAYQRRLIHASIRVCIQNGNRNIRHLFLYSYLYISIVSIIALLLPGSVSVELCVSAFAGRKTLYRRRY